jgi:hypothetical protein
MHRSWIILVLAALVSCAANETNDAEPAFDARMLGRWDGTVHGEDNYPLWFELTQEGGTLGGRLQPRGGHALTFDRVAASGNTLSMTVGETGYEGVFDGDVWNGTGARGDVSFEWTAVRAPALPAPDNPTWGEPIELFNGNDLSGWVAMPGGDNQWRAEDGVLVNEESGANLRTEDKFGDFKLHIEVNVPEHSNSGIYLRGRHEIQVRDDHGKDPHSLNMGGVYGQVTPTSNPSLPAGEWQSFDITLLGRWVTVVLNGETIIDHQEIPGITGGALDANEGEPGPFFLQGDHGRILYRNIVLTPAS